MTDIKLKVDEEIADAGGPSTTGKAKRVTLCVEGNISAGKSTFLRWVSQDNPELADLLEVCAWACTISLLVTRQGCSATQRQLLEPFLPAAIHKC